MEKQDVIIVGGGVVGLAIARELSSTGKDVLLIERYPTFGQETSSRNSEVIHAGIYYEKDSLKAKLCVKGKELLYEFCRKYDVPHKHLGKLIVAINDTETKELKELFKRGKDNGVDDLSLLSKNEVKEKEPNIKAEAALYSPSTGIVDTHKLMKCLESQAKKNGVTLAYSCELISISNKIQPYEIELKDADGEKMSISAPVFINSGGLNSDKIASMVGIDIDKSGYNLYYSKGEYFRVKGSKAGLVKHMIYPTPKEASLGIHTVTDMEGQLKLGPNALYVEKIDYDVDELHIDEFYESTRNFLPFIEKDDLSPDTSGIRAKLQAPGAHKRDFVISEESNKGFPGFINLIGIESPGLTASLAIARYVKDLV